MVLVIHQALHPYKALLEALATITTMAAAVEAAVHQKLVKME